MELVNDLNNSLAQLALAFVNQRLFTRATIIGATTLEQFKKNISSFDVELSKTSLNK